MPTGSDRTRIVSTEAAYWWIRCNDDRGMPRSDRQLFYTWLKRSPENIAEILRISKMDGRFAQQQLFDRVGALEESNVVDGGFGGGVSQYDYQPCDSVSDEVEGKRQTPMLLGLAAAIGALSLTLLLAFVVLDQPVKPNDGTIETAASQWQRMTLEDASSVHVDARTRLKVDFSAQRRIVHLYEGQAAFDVEKDPQRPFIVRTRWADVIAVGTRFSVSVDPGMTAIVEEGVVKVVQHGKEDASPILLARNEQLHVPGISSVKISELNKVKVDAKRKLQWTTGWVDFEDVTIGEMVGEFNRRHATQAQIDAPGIATRRVRYVRWEINSVEKFAEAMDNQEGVTVIEDRPNKTLHLRRE